MTSVAEIPGDELKRVLQDLQTRRRSRIALQSRLLSNATECAAMSEKYAITASKPIIHLHGREAG